MAGDVGGRVTDGLATLPVFAECTREELDQLAGIGTTINVEPGYVFTRQGRRGHEFFVVINGNATCTVDDRVVNKFANGDFFGEMAILEQDVRSATVVADTPMTVLVIGEKEFNAMIEAAPSTGRKVMASLSNRLRAADRRPLILD